MQCVGALLRAPRSAFVTRCPPFRPRTSQRLLLPVHLPAWPRPLRIRQRGDGAPVPRDLCARASCGRGTGQLGSKRVHGRERAPGQDKPRRPRGTPVGRGGRPLQTRPQWLSRTLSPELSRSIWADLCWSRMRGEDDASTQTSRALAGLECSPRGELGVEEKHRGQANPLAPPPALQTPPVLPQMGGWHHTDTATPTPLNLAPAEPGGRRGRERPRGRPPTELGEKEAQPSQKTGLTRVQPPAPSAKADPEASDPQGLFSTGACAPPSPNKQRPFLPENPPHWSCNLRGGGGLPLMPSCCWRGLSAGRAQPGLPPPHRLSPPSSPTGALGQLQPPPTFAVTNFPAPPHPLRTCPNPPPPPPKGLSFTPPSFPGFAFLRAPPRHPRPPPPARTHSPSGGTGRRPPPPLRLRPWLDRGGCAALAGGGGAAGRARSQLPGAAETLAERPGRRQRRLAAPRPRPAPRRQNEWEARRGAAEPLPARQGHGRDQRASLQRRAQLGALPAGRQPTVACLPAAPRPAFSGSGGAALARSRGAESNDPGEDRPGPGGSGRGQRRRGPLQPPGGAGLAGRQLLGRLGCSALPQPQAQRRAGGCPRPGRSLPVYSAASPTPCTGADAQEREACKQGRQAHPWGAVGAWGQSRLHGPVAPGHHSGGPLPSNT